MDAKASQLTPLNDIWPSRGETNNRYASSFQQRQRKPSLVYDEEIMPPGKAITTHKKQHKHKTRTCYRKVTHNCILCNQKKEHCRSQEISSGKTSEIQNCLKNAARARLFGRVIARVYNEMRKNKRTQSRGAKTFNSLIFSQEQSKIVARVWLTMSDACPVYATLTFRLSFSKLTL